MVGFEVLDVVGLLEVGIGYSKVKHQKDYAKLSAWSKRGRRPPSSQAQPALYRIAQLYLS